jgi:hypothetical protein
MSLTSANAVITLSQATLFPVPQQLQNFSADDVTDIEAVRILEHQMGVDGVLSFGFVWVERMQEITLKGDSDSNRFFDTINTFQEAAQEAYPLNGTIILPSAGMMFNLVNGGLETYKPIPAVRKTLQPRRYRIVWNRVQAAPTR